MPKNLVIVESPAKAKTIQKYLGTDYEVKSSFGHIRDLPKKGMGIDLETFQPEYVVDSDKKKLMSELANSVKKADTIWLASDEDREGEAIAWHLAQELKLKNKNTHRIVFHEITKNAILKAIQNPRNIDQNLVDAQQARRILDRIVGFEMSPILWKKVRTGLSAGRVQSVAVRLVVEREQAIENFIPITSFRIEGIFKNENGQEIKARLKEDFENQKEAETFLNECQKSNFKVADIQVKPGTRSPSAPFTTSTLQQEASNRLGYNVTNTMRIAQRLYEEGYITYMRTDSVNLSDEAIQAAKEQIESEFGEKYTNPKKYTTKNTSAQEAHEAIRPTDFKLKNITDPALKSLYQLIYRRALASQMSPAQLEKTQIEISGQPNLKHNFVASGEVIVFDGFLKVYGVETKNTDDGEEQGLLPKVQVNESLKREIIQATQRYSRPPARYTEAALVRKLEELGIGRPSTYAPTIQTIQNRGYVDKTEILPKTRPVIRMELKETISIESLQETFGGDKNKFVPTDIGRVVNDFLTENFAEVLDYGFTAKVEQDFDDIADGKSKWDETIRNFYNDFHPKIIDVEQNADRATGERLLGIDPKSGKNVYARIGRFGPMIQIGEQNDDNKPIYASLMTGQNITTIQLEEALELFKVPFSLNDFQGLPVSVGVGRFGPYVKHGDAFISLPKGEDPLSIDQQRAEEIIHAKQIEDAPIATFKGEPVTKGKGRFGPYIKYLDYFINIPKKYDFENLSDQDIKELITTKLEKEANRHIIRWEEHHTGIENGRWGPFIRYKKSMLKIPRRTDGEKYTPEELKSIPFDTVKNWILEQDKTAFKESAKTKKKPGTSSAEKKKVTPKRTSTRKKS